MSDEVSPPGGLQPGSAAGDSPKPEDRGAPSIAYCVYRMIAYNPPLYALVALCWLLFHGWPLTLGVVAKAFFDALEGQRLVGLTLPGIVALVVALGMAKVAVILGGVGAGAPWRFQLECLLRRNLLAQLLDRPGAQALPDSVGAALSTLRDDVETMTLMADWVFDVVAGAIFAGGGVAILWHVHPRVTLLVFLPIASVVVLAHAARARLERVRAQSRDATARVTGSIAEVFGAVQAIQAACAEERIVGQLGRLGHARRQAVLRDRLVGLGLEAVFANTASLGAGLTLLAAASAMRAGEFSVGDFALFATYLMQVAEYTGFLGYLINTYRQSRVAFARAGALLQGAPLASLVAHRPLYLRGRLPALVPAGRAAGDRLETLEVARLTATHPATGRGITDVSFALRRGTITVVTGRIGAGKTTLLRAVLGLLAADGGEVCWNGARIDDPARVLVPPRVAYTPQVPALLSGTLRDNILLGLPEVDGTLARAVRRAVLDRDVSDFPRGLDTPIGARGVRLSGGQAQRAAAARMFVRAPELLVVDDLSSALDVDSEESLFREMFSSGATCLVVSNRPAVIARADQVLVLDEGRLLREDART